MIWKNRYLIATLVSGLLTAGALRADDTATLLPNAIQYFMDANGKPLANGKVFMYTPSTTTPKTTWTGADKTVAQPQPFIPLGISGRPANPIYGDGSYRQLVKDQFNNTIWDFNTASTGGGGGTPSGPTAGDGNSVGTILAWDGLTPPSNYLFANGQAISRTLYPLYTTTSTITVSAICTSGINVLSGLANTQNIKIGAPVEASCVPPGTTVTNVTSSTVTISANATISTAVTALFFPNGNGDGSTTINLPDLRGRTIVGRNNMDVAGGGGVASSTLNSTYYGTSPNALGAAGGSQSTTLVLLNLPPYTPLGGIGSVLAGNNVVVPVANLTNVGGTTDPNFVSLRNNANTTAGTLSFPVTGVITSTFFGSAQGGASSPFSRVQPSLTLNYIIKVLPDVSTSVATVTAVAPLAISSGSVISLSGIVDVPHGGTGVATLTTGNPLLGNGTNPVTQGTLSGSSTKFASWLGSLTPGNCPVISTNGNLIDSGLPCGSGSQQAFVQDFIGGTDYTAGVTTFLTLASATFSGTISGTTLTASGVTGVIALGQTVVGTGLAVNTTIAAFGTGVGGAGTYTVSVSQSVGPVAMSGALTPPSKNSLLIAFDGVVQSDNTYSLSVNTITFSTAIPTNTLVVDARWSATTAGFSTAGALTWTATQTFNGNAYFCSGYPWVDIRCYGANPSAADNTLAIQSAVNFAETLPTGASARVYVPAGVYCVKSGPITLNAFYTQFSGENLGAILSTCGADITLLRMANVNQKVTDLQLIGKGDGGDNGTFGATQPTLLVDSACIECLVDYVNVFGGLHAIKNASGEAYFYRIKTNNSYGSAMFYSVGGGWYNRLKLDQSAPVCRDVSLLTIPWQANTAYTNCATVSLGGFIIQAQGNGISGASSPTLKNYNIPIIDNTQTWLLARPTIYSGLQLDTGAVENYMTQVDLSGYWSSAFRMTNSLAGAAPSYFKCSQCIFAGSALANVDLEAGNYVFLTDSSLGDVLTAGGVQVRVQPAFGRNLEMTGGYMLPLPTIGGNIGIKLDGGSRINISGMTIETAGGTAIQVAAGISDFIITNNHLEDSAIGVSVGAGGSDYYNIVNNICTGAVPLCVVDGGTGTHKTVSGNH